MNIQIVSFDGFDELDVIGPFSVLQHAKSVGADVHVELVTLDGPREVIAAHGLHIQAQGGLNRKVPPEIVILPGGGWGNRAPQGAWAEAERGDLPVAIADVHCQGAIIATVCAGGMLATAAGLTVNRPATTHHGALDELRAVGAHVIDARVVDDGDLITSGGITSGLDLALWLVERFFGVQVMHQVEKHMEYQRSGTVWQRES